MGAGQSTPVAGGVNPTTDSATVSGSINSSSDSFVKQSEKERRKAIEKEKEKELDGIALVEYKCRRKKEKYTKCVKEFYTDKFLTGESMDQAEYCGIKFENWKECYIKGVKKVVLKQTDVVEEPKAQEQQ